jgi:hypothetical protein
MNGAHENAAQAWACKSQKCKHVPLRLNASNQFIGALIAMLMGVHGAHSIIQWYSTGALWANFRSRGEPNAYQLITYSDHPFNFIGLMGLHLLFVFFGCLGCAFFVRQLLAWLKQHNSGR